MLAKLRDMTFGRGGEQIISFTVNADYREEFDKLKDIDVDIEIKKHKKKRSLDANAYMWALCDKIGVAMGISPVEVYQKNIREVGKRTPLPIREDAVNEFLSIWAWKGVGWFAEVIDDSKLEGYKLVFAYHGSSSYDTAEMSRLIDNVVQDAKALGIPTETPEQIALLKEAWHK